MVEGSFVVEPEVGRESDAAEGVGVEGAGVHGAGVVEDDVAGLVVGHEPAVVAVSHTGRVGDVAVVRLELGRVVGQDAGGAHVAVEGGDFFFLVEIRRADAEVVFDGLAQPFGVFQVDQSAAGVGDVPDGHPGGQEEGVATPEEEFVVVHSRAFATGHVVSEHRTLQEDFFVPAHEVTHELAERWVGDEIQIFRRRVCRDTALEVLTGGIPTTDASMQGSIVR